MINLGTQKPGSTVFVPFESFAGSTGAPITITGLATSDILVYKDGSTTQRASASGFTLLDTDGIDFDGITGIHGFSIDLSDNTTADFWAAGSKYFVVVSTITVDSQTMSFIAATFDIGTPGSMLDTTIATLSSQTSFTLTSGPAEDDALNGQWAIIYDAASAVQRARVLILDYTGSTKTVTLAAGATFTVAAKDNISVMDMAPLQPATLGRTVVVDSAGLVDANTVKVGPTGAGTAQTARDIGLSVLVGDKTGFSLSGAQSISSLTITGAMSIGTTLTVTGATTLAALSTSGTVTFNAFTITGAMTVTGGLVANITGNVSGSIGSVTNKVTVIDIDGITHASVMEMLLAAQTGVATPNGSTTTFFKRDGVTSKFSLTYGGTAGKRTVSTILS